MVKSQMTYNMPYIAVKTIQLGYFILAVADIRPIAKTTSQSGRYTNVLQSPLSKLKKENI